MSWVSRFTDASALFPFLLWAPAVFVVRWIKGPRFPGWAVATLAIVGGWLLFSGGIHAEIESQRHQLTQGPQPPPKELIDRFVHDTGRSVIRMLAPVIALVYAGLWNFACEIIRETSGSLRNQS